MSALPCAKVRHDKSDQTWCSYREKHNQLKSKIKRTKREFYTFFEQAWGNLENNPPHPPSRLPTTEAWSRQAEPPLCLNFPARHWNVSYHPRKCPKTCWVTSGQRSRVLPTTTRILPSGFSRTAETQIRLVLQARQHLGRIHNVDRRSVSLPADSHPEQVHPTKPLSNEAWRGHYGHPYGFFESVRHHSFRDRCKEANKMEYLTGRRQFLQIDDKVSTTAGVEFGVPQGSVLGPVLFNLYVNNLSDHLGPVECHHYANDTAFYVHSKPSDIRECENRLQVALNRMSSWSKGCNLALNPAKTKSFNAVQNGGETPEKNLTNWWSPVLTKLKLILCSISPSPPYQCWLAIIQNNMDWQHGNIGLGGEVIIGWALEPVFSVLKLQSLN